MLLSPEQIVQLISLGESENLECKLTTGARKEATQTVCAMLNRNGGLVVFGVKPDGQVVGQDVGDNTVEKVSTEIQKIEPSAYPKIERIKIAGNKELIVVQVHSGPLKPYRYKGVPYLRVGNTTQIMSGDEYNRMLLERLHSEKRWENQTAEEWWTIDDLDHAEIRNTVSEAVRLGRLNEPESRNPEDLLRGLGLLRDGVLLRAAAVLFGNEERLRLEMPQCLLKVAKFRGLDRSEFIDNRQFTGNAFSLLFKAMNFLIDNNPIASRFEPTKIERIDEPLYPPLAVREALANAICHRDYTMGGGSIGLAVYDNRLEVTSPGGLHFGLTPEALFQPHESRPWNPLIARAFYIRGIIEEWGRGTLKIVDWSTASGLPHPEIKEENNSVTVRFLSSDTKPSQEQPYVLTKQQEEILKLLKSKGALPLRDIHAAFGVQVSKRRIREELAILKKKKLVKSKGIAKNARWYLLRG